MFGKPHWFRKKIGWGLTPITVQGWAYALAWAAILALPFMLLAVREQGVEAMVWLAASGGLLVYDVRHIMTAMQPQAPADDVMYIGDDEPLRDHLATRNFNFRLRR